MLGFYAARSWSTCLLCCVLLTPYTLAALREYCYTEAFEAKCGRHEVIMLQVAHYGRMAVGRCVKANFGFVGCYRDVLDLADRRCSGRRYCRIAVPDSEFEARKPCNEEFKSYLAVSYTCVAVANTQDRRCRVSRMQAGSHHVTLVAPNAYIANVITDETGCGANTAPWRIVAKSGQRINVTLHDFSTFPIARACYLYATVKDTALSKPPQSVCRGAKKIRHVFTSATNSVDINIMRKLNVDEKQKGYFLLEYKFISCVDPPLPSNMWFNRTSADIAVVGCKHTIDRWKLRCEKSVWTGSVGNCTTLSETDASRSSYTRKNPFFTLPLDITVAVVASIAFIISVIIFTIGLFVLRSRQARETRDRNKHVCLAPRDGYSEGRHYIASVPSKAHRQTLAGSSGDSTNENEYAYVWEVHSQRSLTPPGTLLRNHSEPCTRIVTSLQTPWQLPVNAQQPQQPEVRKGVVPPQYGSEYCLDSKNQS